MTGKVFTLTDENVRSQAEKFAPLLTIPPGEKSKSRAMKARIEDALFALGCDRQGKLIAFGGGVVNDLTGFIAATFCRGIPWIAHPTSLVAMIDASIGGKVGINTPAGKNTLGAFYPPEEVILNLSYLETLPEQEWKNGVAEMLKYGMIADPTLLEDPRSHQAIEKAIAIKKAIVSADPNEQGLRRILNFGHTAGHAFEVTSDYALPHGEAVGSGLFIAARLSYTVGSLPSSELDAIERCLAQHGFIPRPITEREIDAMRRDKKGVGGSPRFVLLERLGKPLSFEGAYCTAVDLSVLEEVACA